MPEVCPAPLQLRWDVISKLNSGAGWCWPEFALRWALGLRRLPRPFTAVTTILGEVVKLSWRLFARRMAG